MGEKEFERWLSDPRNDNPLDAFTEMPGGSRLIEVVEWLDFKEQVREMEEDHGLRVYGV